MASPSDKAVAHTAAGKKMDSQKGDLLDLKVLEWLTDPDVINELPASAKAQIILSRIPKAQQVDQKFEERMLSLTSILDRVPSMTQDGTSIQALHNQMSRVNGELVLLRVENKAYKTRMADDSFEGKTKEAFIVLIRKVWDAACTHYRHGDVRAESLLMTLDGFLRDFDELLGIKNRHIKSVKDKP